MARNRQRKVANEGYDVRDGLCDYDSGDVGHGDYVAHVWSRKARAVLHAGKEVRRARSHFEVVEAGDENLLLEVQEFERENEHDRHLHLIVLCLADRRRPSFRSCVQTPKKGVAAH